MKEIQQVLQQVQQASGSIDKMNLIKRNESLLGLVDIIQFIYNPYFKTGISEAKAAAALGISWQIPESKEVSYMDIMTYLKAHNTGSDADIYQVACFFRSHRDTEWLAKAIVTQKLTIGLTSTSFNKIFGEQFIPKVGCMLGKPYEDVKNVEWPCIVTEKLDGIRRLLIKENGISRFYSRSGHEDTGLMDIAAEAENLPDNHVYDGELLAIGTFKDNIALRQATSSLSAGKGNKTGLRFNIFDMVPLSEFYNTSIASTSWRLPADVRKGRLDNLFNNPEFDYLTGSLKYIAAVPILGIAKNFDEVAPLAAAIWNQGGEGVMLNTVNGRYEIKRSKHLLKVKRVEEITLPIKGFIEGNGKYMNAVGAILVEYKGQTVGVGSGLTDMQRMTIWSTQEDYLDKMIEIEHFGESTNAAGTVSLNCPIFKRFVGEE